MDKTTLEESLTGLALAAGMAMSETPVSLALTVPGEPHLLNGSLLLNCVRFPIMEEEDYPALEDAIIMPPEERETASLDEECHLINLHDAHGRWRLDFSFHFVNGDEGTVGVAGLILMESSRVPENQWDSVREAIVGVGKAILSGYDRESSDPMWAHPPSTALH